VNFSSASAPLKLGFLSVLEEPGGYVGGYLVTNAWGRPLEFRISNPVQPNRVQQILYGDTLRPYIFADVIGKTLVEKTATSVQVIVTDCRPALDLRRSIEIPVAWLIALDDCQDAFRPHDSAELEAPRTSPANSNIQCHPEFAGDKTTIGKVIERLPDSVDLAEPFARIREAIAEARKIGVTSRAS
jgi:hypothetical protein